ncbi:hypothetical protein B7486_56175, partial [cyanobacterium TDX16]
WALQTGFVAFRAGQLATLLPALREMAASSDIAVNWQAPFGMALLADGHRDEAMAVLDGFDAPPLDFFWLSTTQGFAELAVSLERDDEVTRLYEMLTPHRGQLGMTSSGALLFGLVDLSLGQLAHALGHDDQARVHLAQAVAEADRTGSAFEAAKARRFLAASLLRSDDTGPEVSALLAEARELAEAHGFEAERALLADLVIATP